MCLICLSLICFAFLCFHLYLLYFFIDNGTLFVIKKVMTVRRLACTCSLNSGFIKSELLNPNTFSC